MKRSCVGRYQLTSPVQVTITMDDGQLFVQYGTQPKAELFPESTNQFFLKVANAQVTFERDRDGNVVSLVHHQHGSATQGVRLVG
ncbi:DUF3471 domain-containing protein [Paraburkholderia megapolitana]|uniref:DUF3471 domain-containing protein n=1 Tax=Paraburkholderia megapolitana TaxID=420953 RepID=UPI0038B9CD77